MHYSCAQQRQCVWQVDLLWSPSAGEVIEVSVGTLQSQLLHQGLHVAVTRAIICKDRNRHSHQCEARNVEVGVLASMACMRAP